MDSRCDSFLKDFSPYINKNKSNGIVKSIQKESKLTLKKKKHEYTEVYVTQRNVRSKIRNSKKESKNDENYHLARTMRTVLSSENFTSTSDSDEEDQTFSTSSSSESKSISTYVTCKTSQNDNNAVKDTSINIEPPISEIKITPRPADKVSSCEKVQQWLKLNNSARKQGKYCRRKITLNKSSSDEASTYPNTMSTNSQPSLSSYLQETSRVISSQESHVQSTISDAQVSVLNNIKSTMSIDKTQSGSSRSSSMYFVDRPPWSKHYQSRQNTKKQLQKSTIVSDTSYSNSSTELSTFENKTRRGKKQKEPTGNKKTFTSSFSTKERTEVIPESISTESSFNLVYDLSEEIIKPEENRKSFESVPSTVLWPNSSISTLPSELCGPSYQKRKEEASKNEEFFSIEHENSRLSSLPSTIILPQSVSSEDNPVLPKRRNKISSIIKTSITNHRLSISSEEEFVSTSNAMLQSSYVNDSFPRQSNSLNNKQLSKTPEKQKPTAVEDINSELHHQYDFVQGTSSELNNQEVSIIELSSDTDEESTNKVFRKHTNRQSYIEIISSESEEEEKIAGNNFVAESDENSDVNDEASIAVIPESEEDDTKESEEDDTKESCENIRNTNEDFISQETYFSQSESLNKQINLDTINNSDSSSEKHLENDRFVSKSKKISISPRVSIAEARTRIHAISSESSDDEERFEKFFAATRAKREQFRTVKEVVKSPAFIVPDDEIEETSSSESETESGICNDKEKAPVNSLSFYFNLLNIERKKQTHLEESCIRELTPRKPVHIDESWSPELESIPHKTTELKTLDTVVSKPKSNNKSKVVTSTTVTTITFLESLSATCNLTSHPEAIPFIKKFKANRQELTSKLFALYNRNVFLNKLDSEMQVVWNNRLRSTAGYCANKRKVLPNGNITRTSQIELSTKIINTPGRLRDTLIHEMCHAATWVISGVLGGHGSVWRQWTHKARVAFPELPPIKVCHTYEIETKYTYKCTACSYSFGRLTKSVDIERKVCGICRGRFELLINEKKKDSTQTKPPTAFALFVKENYKVVKADKKCLKHADVMKILSAKFAEHKILQKNKIIINEQPKETI